MDEVSRVTSLPRSVDLAGLFNVLDQSFPDRLPTRELTPFEQGRLLGARDVIEKIKSMNRDG